MEVENVENVENDESLKLKNSDNRQIAYQIKTMEKHVISFTELARKFGAFASELDDIASFLNELPSRIEDKIEEKIKAISPTVAQDIQSNLTVDLQQSIQKCHDMTSIVMEKTDNVLKKDLLKFFQGVAILVILSTSAAVGGTYFVMKKFPQRFFVNTTGDITVNNSTLSVSGKTPVNVNKNNNVK